MDPVSEILYKSLGMNELRRVFKFDFAYLFIMAHFQPAFTSAKLAMETPGQCVKSVQT